MGATRSMYISALALVLFGILMGIGTNHILRRLGAASLANPVSEDWEAGRHCDAFERLLKASALSGDKSLHRRVGGFYARGECVYQDLSRAEMMFLKSGLESKSDIGVQFLLEAVALAQDDSPVTNEDVRARFNKILGKANEYGVPCPAQSQYQISARSYPMFRDQLCK